MEDFRKTISFAYPEWPFRRAVWHDDYLRVCAIAATLEAEKAALQQEVEILTAKWRSGLLSIQHEAWEKVKSERDAERQRADKLESQRVADAEVIAGASKAIKAANMEITRLNHYMERVAGIEEKAHLQTIDERDAAEEAMSQAYFLIKGESPKWSNCFGYDDALQDIDDAQRCLRAEIKQHETTLASLRGQFATARRDALEQCLAHVNAVKQTQAVLRDKAHSEGRYGSASSRDGSFEACFQIEERIRALTSEPNPEEGGAR